MLSNIIDKCCDQCWHSEEKPCPNLVECLTGGPLCHDSDSCTGKIEDRKHSLLRKKHEKTVIFVGAGTCGLAAGAGKTIKAISAYLKDHAIDADIVEVGCIGCCAFEPLVDVQLPGKNRISFHTATEDVIVPILDGIMKGSLSDELLLSHVMGQHPEPVIDPADGADSNGKAWDSVSYIFDHPFFAHQTRWVLANCGIINPASLGEYIVRGGYSAFAKALKEYTPKEVCEMVETSGLRGRGGAGFPTGKKWKFAAEEPSNQRYLVCNADEGDPGAFMDRAVIEGDPHRLIEGLLLASYAIGASKAYVYIRAEYPLAIKRLEEAIRQASELGLLGDNILDSGFSLKVIIKKGAGAFVCGEETALMHSIEGKRGMPRPRPPYPSTQGLFNKPTVIDNVESLVNVPDIIAKGPEWFNAVGTENSKGTKVFALSGKISRTGLAEVAMGTQLKDIIYKIGGGIPDNKEFKAVQIGGPSGGCIPVENLEIDVDYESLKKVGAMMGSGGLVVMDEDTCMVDVAKYFMDFIQRESCGKCIPCREGTLQMLDILNRITGGRRDQKGNAALERFKGVMQLERLAKVIKDTSLCGLGQSAPNPVLSTLRWFRNEYEEHVYNRKCPAKACQELNVFTIDIDKCKGCTLCAKKCPVDAIIGSAKNPHYIVEDKCVGCGTCLDVCKFDAVTIA